MNVTDEMVEAGARGLVVFVDGAVGTLEGVPSDALACARAVLTAALAEHVVVQADVRERIARLFLEYKRGNLHLKDAVTAALVEHALIHTRHDQTPVEKIEGNQS
jgi:predicted outer membrane lipoprotein